MKKQIWFVEVGVILPKTHEEFDCYHISNFYENEYSFFDENLVMFFEQDEALEWGKNYIDNGVENTYCIVHDSCQYNLGDEQIQEINDFHYADNVIETPSIDSTCYFVIKKNNEIEVIINEKI